MRFCSSHINHSIDCFCSITTRATFACLPILNSLGVLPRFKTLLSFLLDFINVTAFGGSSTASSLRGAVYFTSSLVRIARFAYNHLDFLEPVSQSPCVLVLTQKCSSIWGQHSCVRRTSNCKFLKRNKYPKSSSKKSGKEFYLLPNSPKHKNQWSAI